MARPRAPRLPLGAHPRGRHLHPQQPALRHREAGLSISADRSCALFERAEGGEFGNPRVIGPTDDGAGTLGVFGPRFVTAPDGKEWLVFAFDDPRTNGEDNTEGDIWCAPFTPGESLAFGNFRRTPEGTIVADGLRMFPLATDRAGFQGNPHLAFLAGGGAVLLADDEFRTHDIYMAFQGPGEFPNGPWSPWVRLPPPVCLPVEEDGYETQPDFDGEYLYFRRNSVILRSRYLGGDPAASSSWEDPVQIVGPGANPAVGEMVVAGEPSFAWIRGDRWLSFIEAVSEAGGDVNPGVTAMKEPRGCFATGWRPFRSRAMADRRVLDPSRAA
jgi:hypothetical protein